VERSFSRLDIIRLNRIVYPSALRAIPMYFGWIVRRKSIAAARAFASEQGMSVQKLQLLLCCPTLAWLQDQFAIVITSSLRFPQFFWLGVRVRGKV
jgi:hypothetical protein